MSIRLATITAVSFLVASPALADCGQELAMLEQPAVSAETGASTDILRRSIVRFDPEAAIATSII